MKKKSLCSFCALLITLAVTPVYASETWTDIGVYLFATEISGEIQRSNVTADVEVGFDDIVENLDLGYMAYLEHRRDKWSFIGDLAFLRLTDEGTSASDNILQVELDAELEQTVFEGFVGYRVYEQEREGSDIGLDVLAGFRHTDLKAELSSEASLLGLTTSRGRELDEDWTDTVLAIRLQLGDQRQKGWGGTFWLDVGDGSDSSSEQFLAMATYRGQGQWQYFGGYRYLNLEYETGSGTSKFGVDLDYTGPMFGASYRIE